MMKLPTRLLAALGFALLGAATAGAEDPEVLWKLISTRCLPNLAQGLPPAPCAAVDLTGGTARGYVVLKDREGATQFLVMPTAKITGMEDPAILAPDAANYFAYAWAERGRMDLIAGRAFPRDTVSLAINSVSGRSQNQLHIHIDCIAADVRAALRLHQAAIGTRWSQFPVPLKGHRYLAMRLTGEDLSAVNPLKLIAETVPGAQADMGHHSLVVAGVMLPGGQPGFFLLDTQADPAAGNFASGEELQDHACNGV